MGFIILYLILNFGARKRKRHFIFDINKCIYIKIDSQLFVLEYLDKTRQITSAECFCARMR